MGKGRVAFLGAETLPNRKGRVAFLGAASGTGKGRVAFLGADSTPAGKGRVAFLGAASPTVLTAVVDADSWLEPYCTATLDGSLSAGVITSATWTLLHESVPGTVPAGQTTRTGLTATYTPNPHWEPVTLTWELEVADGSGTSSAVLQHTVAPYMQWQRKAGAWRPILSYRRVP